MDRAVIRRLLEASEQRAEDAAERVARQRRLVAGLERNLDGHHGNGRQVAAAILEQLELSHRIMVAECERLRRKLAQRIL
jgi:hypothetical protein